jgi:hypothetical protein
MLTDQFAREGGQFLTDGAGEFGSQGRSTDRMRPTPVRVHYSLTDVGFGLVVRKTKRCWAGLGADVKVNRIGRVQEQRTLEIMS